MKLPYGFLNDFIAGADRYIGDIICFISEKYNLCLAQVLRRGWAYNRYS